MVLSIPLLPELLRDKRWAFATGALFLLSPVVLSLVSPGLTRVSRGRKMLFAASLWLSAAVFMALVFFLFVRANAVPLSLALTLFVSLLVLAAFFYGIRPGIALKSLVTACLLLSLTAILQSSFFPQTATEALKEEGRGRKVTLIAAGPYLQNLQKNSVTIMWETSAPMPGKVIMSRRKEALLSQSTEDCRVVTDEARVKIHEIRIDSLLDNTRYYYQVISNNHADQIGSFQTGHDGEQPFQFVVYGDSQEVFGWVEYLVRNRHQDTCESILRHSPDARFIVHTGDMTFLGNQHERWGREFFGPARELMRNTVVWPVLGNHELNASWYFDYFSVPNEDEHYYSFDFGNSHFIVLAVEGYAVGHEYGPPKRTPMDPGSPQYAWLERDLANSQAKTWRFVFFHQSAVSSGLEGSYTPAREILSPLFEKYAVAAVFSGHDHNFEFSVKDNVVYIITGGGGGPVNAIPLDARKNPYSRYFRGTWHHCSVDVSGKQFQVKAIDLNGTVFHRITVDKSSGSTTILAE